MSREAVIAFLRKVADDPGLQEELVGFARERGFEFTVEELGDSELDSVTGGAAFAKYDTIEGEATDKDHKGWTDLASIPLKTDPMAC